eukprot:s3048_g24.t1
MAWQCPLRSASPEHIMDLDSGADSDSLAMTFDDDNINTQHNGSTFDCATTVVLSQSDVLCPSQETPEIEDFVDIDDTRILDSPHMLGHRLLPNPAGVDHEMSNGGPAAMIDFDPWNISCHVVRQLIGDTNETHISRKSEYDEIRELCNWRPSLHDNETLPTAESHDEMHDENMDGENTEEFVAVSQDSSDDTFSKDSYSDESLSWGPSVSSGGEQDDMDKCAHCRFVSFCSACGSELHMPCRQPVTSEDQESRQLC